MITVDCLYNIIVHYIKKKNNKYVIDKPSSRLMNLRTNLFMITVLEVEALIVRYTIFKSKRER